MPQFIVIYEDSKYKVVDTADSPPAVVAVCTQLSMASAIANALNGA